MNHVDMIALLDRKYTDNPVPCPNETRQVKMKCGYTTSSHGNLHVHASGTYIVCGICGYQEAVGRPD